MAKRLLKIIDFEKKGNLVRFYLGNKTLKLYYGDDWDDCPYEHNAGIVYDHFVKSYVDVVFPYGYDVMEPADDWRNQGNSAWCKDDMRERRVPCIIAVPPEIREQSYMDGFNYWVAQSNIVKFYFGDEMESCDSVVCMAFNTKEKCVVQKFMVKG